MLAGVSERSVYIWGMDVEWKEVYSMWICVGKTICVECLWRGGGACMCV